MSGSALPDTLVERLQRKYGRAEPLGKSRLFRFGSGLICSINYSKLLGGYRYFFGLSQGILHPATDLPTTDLGHFVLLVCGSVDNVLVLPRDLVLQMMSGVSSRRLDIHVEDGSYILQTTGHPKMVISQFLNAYPEPPPSQPEMTLRSPSVDAPERAHVKAQWQLIQLGRAEGCSVWVPVSDRSLSYRGHPFSRETVGRLPGFGFDENTRRIVQNIDVLWLDGNAIAKACEIESTTMIYSGLLRMNDLVLSQPNVRIDLFLVAAEGRRGKVHSQLTRPTFRSLIQRCQFVTFEYLDEQTKRLDGLPLDSGVRISGLVRGERFEMSELFDFPTTA